MSAAGGAAPASLAGPLQAHLDALPAGWRDLLRGVLESAQTRTLARYVDARLAVGCVVYPARPLAALHACAPRDTRVVVLGQDPYHGPGQAHGLAFSVPAGVPPPPSLRNIFAELARDCGCPVERPGDLGGWARQGVLLLNTVLTVEQGSAASHAGHGWEAFTDAIVDRLAWLDTRKVYMLWGAHAQAKASRVRAADAAALVLEANHPSPLSARRAPVPFIGCGHFSKANEYLAGCGLAPIDWCR